MSRKVLYEGYLLAEVEMVHGEVPVRLPLTRNTFLPLPGTPGVPEVAWDEDTRFLVLPGDMPGALIVEATALVHTDGDAPSFLAMIDDDDQSMPDTPFDGVANMRRQWNQGEHPSMVGLAVNPVEPSQGSTAMSGICWMRVSLDS